MGKEFTADEIKALKELAQEKIFFDLMAREGAEYRNRFETWEDAYVNLKRLGFSHKDIVKRIGEKG